MKNWSLARRDLLKSLGAGAACLPLLRATNAFGQTAPRRFIVLQMSEGLRQGAWKPGTGPLTTLPKSNAPFEPHKADMVFIPGLNNPGGGGGHGSYGCVYYGLGGTGGGQYKEPTGKTVDQIVAGGLPKATTGGGRPSLNLHVQLERAPRSTTMPGGSKCFWTGAGQPINPIGDPYMVYKDLFGGLPDMPAPTMNNAAEVKKLMMQKKSILDYLGSSLEQFQARVGTEDRDAIGGHLQSIRELEMQLQAAPVDAGKCGGQPTGPMIDLNVDASYPLILKAHLNLMTAALKCGITNVATLQTGDSSGNNINFGSFVEGLPARSKNNYKSPFRNWHDLGHNPVMDGTDHKQIVDQWFFARWAEFFAQLKMTPDGGGTLWDSTLILIGNHMEEGANHSSNAIPWMLAGKGGAKLNYGNCVSGSGSGVKSVMAGICNSLGVAMHPYGAPLNGLMKA
jgi:hypothetical protein